MAHIQTVTGPVAPEELGRILPHEHLLMLVPGPWLNGGTTEDDLVDVAVRALQGLHGLGFQTVVDLTPYGFPRDLSVLAEISRRSSVHIIAGSSIYLEAYSPDWALEANLETMHDRFVRDATEGDETGIKIGILGEQATGLNEITPHEEKCLRAAARAHRDTGLSLNTHTTHGTMALEQVEILRQEGADLSRVVIGHMDIQPDANYVRRVLDTGVNIAFDTLGKQCWDFVLAPPSASPSEGESAKRAYFRSDASRIDEIADLVARGYASQLLLSLDMTGAEVYLNPSTHGQVGYSFLGKTVVPQLAGRGVADSAIEQMVRHNPARLLTLT